MKRLELPASVAGLALVWSTAVCGDSAPQPLTLHPDRMPRVGSVDERYQSYNIEMVEVTGGRFWKPYPRDTSRSRAGEQAPAGATEDRYQYRAPIDLSNARLRKLATALGPAYVRVSGTWANSTYFADSDEALSAPPAGYGGVLTRQQWKGAIDFARAVNANIVTSFAISTGTRDSTGVWTPQEAHRLIAYTRAVGGSIAAAELMNEPTLPAIGAAPPGYDAVAFGRDFQVFRKFAQNSAPDMLILGPGSTGETDDAAGNPNKSALRTPDLLEAMGPDTVNAFSYHHYGAVSQRCDGPRKAADGLSEEWLARTDHPFRFYQKARDEFEPGKPLWVTETAETACGGNPWATRFIDTFRYLDQLGRLARQGVRVVAHNTLAASDYGLLDERDFAPRPNYWGSLLWRRLMGTTVLDSGIPIGEGQHIYAHCLRDVPGGVALLAINNDQTSPRTLRIGTAGLRYTLSASPLASRAVKLNGLELRMGADDELPPLTGAKFPAGTITLEPATITFLTLPDAGNQACRHGGG